MMNKETIEFLAKAKQIKPNWQIDELLQRENEINSIVFAQVEAARVRENEQAKEVCCANCIDRLKRFNIEPCLTCFKHSKFKQTG